MRPVRLYLDDLERIVDHLQEVSKDIRITAQGYECDNLTELPLLKKPYLTDVEIRSSDPYIADDLKPTSVWLYMSRDDPASRGVFDALRTELHNARRPLTWLIASPFFSGGFAGISVVLLLNWLQYNKLWLTIAGVASVLLAAAWVYVSLQTQLRKFSIIIPKHRSDVPTFWQRNSDKIILALISALIGSLLTIAIKTLSGK